MTLGALEILSPKQATVATTNPRISGRNLKRDQTGVFELYRHFSIHTTVEHSWMFMRTRQTLTVSRRPASPLWRRLARRCQLTSDMGLQTCLLSLSRQSRSPADPYGPTNGSPFALLDCDNTHPHTGCYSMMQPSMQNSSCTDPSGLSFLVTLLRFSPSLSYSP